MQTSKRPSGKGSVKASKNEVGVQVFRGRIRLSLPREISRAAYGVEQKIVSPGVEATKEALKAYQGKAAQMSADIATGNFDVSLVKYELGVVASNKLLSIDGGKKPEIGLLELWEKFKEYKRPNLAETTFRRRWEGIFTNTLVKAMNETDKTPVAIRNFIISTINPENAKNLLSQLEAAYKWGIQHELVTKNPYLGMASEVPVKKKKEEDDSFNEYGDVRAFSYDEMNAIIEYLETTPKVEHYANLVKFLFYAGCRPGEAAALRWKHISPDCKNIRFSQNYDTQLKVTKSTKTDTTRIFPCHQKLQALLLKIKPENVNPETLIFTSKTGKQIDWRVFHRIWHGSETHERRGIIKTLIEEGKVRQYLKPYATRHTFITLMVDKNVPAHVVAAWVGNSADIIWKHYYQHQQNYPIPEM